MHLAQSRQASWLLLFGTVALLAVGGCGGQTLYPVKGKVVYQDGSDVAGLAHSLVFFDPVESETATSPHGEIQEDGSFLMSTLKEGDGAPPGRYRVRIAQHRISWRKPPPRLVDPRFEDSETSGLDITVTGPVADYILTVQKP